MKKLLFLALFTTLHLSAFAALDTKVQYQGYTDNFSFTVSFPPDWEAKTFGDDLQGFSPKKERNPAVLIKEFENRTYLEAISSYLDENTELHLIKDKILNNYPVKEVVFYNTDVNQKYAVTFFKRGSLVIALSNPSLPETENFPVPKELNPVVQELYNSFSFNDDWNSYLDQKSQFHFNLPPGLQVRKTAEGLDIITIEKRPKIVFQMFKFQDLNIKEIIDQQNLKASDLNKIHFHGLPATQIIFEDPDSEKKFSRIFLESNNSIFVLPDLNLEKDFPHKNHYNEYLKQIHASFIFFNLEEEYKTFRHFSDVSDSHPNQEAINHLYEKKIVNGFENQTFNPDGEVQRAELIKMLVINKANPDPAKYQNCFSDVKNEWFAPFVCYAKEKHWISGYPDGTFRPLEGINRAEAIKIMLTGSEKRLPHKIALKNTAVADIRRGDWFSRYFNFADNQNLLDKQHIETDGSVYFYFPQNKMTRKEVAETLYRISKK